MTKLWVVLAMVLFGLLAQAGTRDVKKTYELINKGEALSSRDADSLEERIAKKPEDAEARIQLLSYYSRIPARGALSAIKAARLKHILWLVAHDPEEGLGLFQIATGIYLVNRVGDDLADAEACRLVSDLWLEQMKKNAGNVKLRREAVEAILFCSPELAEQAMAEMKDEAGLGRLYAYAVLGVTGRSYANRDPLLSDAALRASPFAKKAQGILDEATDQQLLMAAVGTLLRTGAILWADGKLDWDYTSMGHSLLAKIQEEAVDPFVLLTLPRTLPARGDRPPAMLRIGGNVQSRQLVQKVSPVYPTGARDAGIEGTVRMTALIGLDGKVLHLRPESGHAKLVPASVDAVRQWMYKPTLLNGKPCYVLTQVDVNYVLSPR